MVKGKAKKKVAFSPPERSAGMVPQAESTATSVTDGGDAPQPQSPHRSAANAGLPQARSTVHSVGTILERTPTAHRLQVGVNVSVDLLDDESMDERVKVDDLSAKVAQTSPWLSRKRKPSGANEEEEEGERVEGDGSRTTDRSPNKRQASEPDVTTSAVLKPSSASTTSSRVQQARHTMGVPLGKENLPNAAVTPTSESGSSSKQAALERSVTTAAPPPAAAERPRAAPAAPVTDKTSPTKSMKQTSLFSMGITPSRGSAVPALALTCRAGFANGSA
jgi:hypothetical protein